MKKCLSLAVCLTALLAVTGCTNDNYDGLIVIDGNLKRYSLRHSFGDLYFVNDIDEATVTKYTKEVIEANNKLKNKDS